MAKLDLNVEVDVKGQDKLRGLGSTLGSAAVNVAKIGVAAGAAFAGVGVLTANFASDLNESLSKVGVVFGRNADDIEKWAETSAESLGISEQQALEAAGTFGNLFTAMDIGQKPAADMSQNLVDLSADLASFNNANPEDVLLALRSGLVGESEPLRKFGVQLSAARIEAKAMELGLQDANGELSAAAKSQAAYSIILEDTATAQGDFERTSDGMANQQRILAATFDDTMATIGQAFVPIIQELLPGITAGLTGFASWVQANMPMIQSVASTVFGAIGTAISFLFTTVIPTLVSIFQGAVGWITSNMPAIQGTVGGVFDTISGVISSFTQNVLPVLLTIFQQVVGWITSNMPLISSVAGQVFGAIESIIKTVSPIIEALATHLFPVVGAAASVLFEVMDVAFKGIGGAFEVLGEIFDTVGGLIEDIFRSVVGVVKGIWNTFVGFWNGIEISVPSVDVPFVGKLGGFSIGVPDLPMLAAGGIVTAPTLALIGERGPEAVIPLDGQHGMGGVNIEVNVLGDLRAETPEEVASAIGRALWSSGITDQTVFAGGG